MIVFSYYPSDTRVRREAEALAKAGMSVDVISLLYESEPQKESINAVNVYRLRFRKRRRSGKLHHIFQYSYFIIASFFKLSFLHLKKKYDFIHVHNLPDILVLSALLPRITGSKIILDMHEIMPEFFMRKFDVSEQNIIIKLLIFIEKISIKLTEHVIVATPFLKETVIKRSTTRDKVTTILNLPDINYFQHFKANIRKKPETFNLVYPGTFSKIHGVDIAIQAVRKIVDNSNINIRFYLYGLGEEEKYLHSLVEELDLQQHVEFNKMVQIDELAKILSNMDIGLVPKRDGVFIGEAISTKMFDFAAVGLPIISSKTAGDSLYFDDTMVQFFEPENIDELADCIIKLYYDYELRKKYSENATKLIHKMNWNIAQKELIDIFRK